MASKIEQLKVGIGGDISDFNRELQKLERSAKGFGTTIGKVGRVGATALTGLGVAAAGFAAVAVDAFSDFEEGIVSVQKTTDLSGEELERFKEDIMGLSETIPLATTELLQIAGAAGQLGIKGRSDLVKFTEVIAKLGKTTDIQGEAAAKSLARILNITGESIGSVDKLAAAIVDVGNNFATSESEIVSSASEIAKATSNFNISSDQIVGLAGAMTSLGIQAESGGTVIGKSFRALDATIRQGIGPAFVELSRLTGIAQDDLKNVFGDDPSRVFQLFVEGLQDVAKGGGDVAAKLQEFGLTGERVFKVLPTLAQRSDILGQAFSRAGQAAKDATALNEEAAKAFNTTASQLVLAQNKIQNTLAIVGEELAPEIIQAVNDITQVVLENKESLIAIAQAIAMTVKAIGTVFEVARAGFVFLFDAEGRALKKLVTENSKQQEFLKKQLEKRGLSEKQFAAAQKKIREGTAAHRKRLASKTATQTDAIAIADKKRKEKIAKARAGELQKIEKQNNERLVKLNQERINKLTLEDEGASRDTIDRKQEQIDALAEIDRLERRRADLELKETLSDAEREELSQTDKLLDIHNARYQDLLEKQDAFEVASMSGFADLRTKIERDFELNPITISTEFEDPGTIPTGGGGDDGGSGGDDGGSGGGGGGDGGGDGGGGGTTITIEAIDCSTGAWSSYTPLPGHGCAGGYEAALGSCRQKCCPGYHKGTTSNDFLICVEDAAADDTPTDTTDGGQCTANNCARWCKDNGWPDDFSVIVNCIRTCVDSGCRNIPPYNSASMSGGTQSSTPSFSPGGGSPSFAVAPGSSASGGGSQGGGAVVVELSLKDDLVNFITARQLENDRFGI